MTIVGRAHADALCTRRVDKLRWRRRSWRRRWRWRRTNTGTISLCGGLPLANSRLFVSGGDRNIPAFSQIGRAIGGETHALDRLIEREWRARIGRPITFGSSGVTPGVGQLISVARHDTYLRFALCDFALYPLVAARHFRVE